MNKITTEQCQLLVGIISGIAGRGATPAKRHALLFAIGSYELYGVSEAEIARTIGTTRACINKHKKDWLEFFNRHCPEFLKYVQSKNGPIELKNTNHNHWRSWKPSQLISSR